VTLGRLVLAWVPVAVWFTLATFAIPLLGAALSKPAGQSAVFVAAPVPVAKALLKWRLVEAGLLTLFASLWFDSIGSGGWWLLFLLVGALATIPTWLPPRHEHLPRRARVAGACADVARYIVARAILAWRLG
jgi:hypothetical protein